MAHATAHTLLLLTAATTLVAPTAIAQSVVVEVTAPQHVWISPQHRPVMPIGHPGGIELTGVAVDVAERIFEPFDRGHRQDGDPSAGVGLGLALSRELSRDLGGSLTLCEGRPTVFRLQLPL